ncbi:MULTISPECIES: metallophosphoesterase family protein [Brevibacillus]|uniref:metallophosphoesterase family protein n=1 Tax=Brevibacillus TaxID=55080 RepID=UPI00046ADB3F|nr:metallophosphoesterase family protein [Brevibacillus borstelensis]MCC0562983.1 serine/threonine protein phosphatase [Brevibacillus borstelensis]MCM3623154.1 serine/threonine protein phosphatase [Brevibacillus borstelensis]MED1872188.1 metallophosphoesterase family protein [Brevibacillus borstelensis]NOU55678.1 serine/threonine protein phosphatase [Brevibacillus borstelensis]
MRTFVISDIHGMYDEFCEMLEQISFDADSDKLILLGDYIDRGCKSKEVVQRVKALTEQQQAIAIKGNHDEMFLEFLYSGEPQKTERYLRNGGKATLESFCGTDWFQNEVSDQKLQSAREHILQHYAEEVAFLQQLPYYYETKEHIFVHAGINPAYEDWRETPPYEMIWIRDAFYHQPVKEARTVVFGHTTCSTLHEKPDVWFGERKIGIDGACVYGSQLNCLEIKPDGYAVHVVRTKNPPNLAEKQ